MCWRQTSLLGVSLASGLLLAGEPLDVDWEPLAPISSGTTSGFIREDKPTGMLLPVILTGTLVEDSEALVTMKDASLEAFREDVVTSTSVSVHVVEEKPLVATDGGRIALVDEVAITSLPDIPLAVLESPRGTLLEGPRGRVLENVAGTILDGFHPKEFSGELAVPLIEEEPVHEITPGSR